VIVTPDQRLRVFVSSTLVELAAERAAAREAIESLRLTPVLFELGARPHPPRQLYVAYLEQSDVFVGIYGESYGWVAPDMDVSGLEDEYRLAGEKPRLLYLKRPAPAREDRLTALIEQIKAEGDVSYRTFRDADELKRLLQDDLSVLLSERFRPQRSDDATRVRARLPASVDRFVGRDHELAALAGLLVAPDARLITVTGPGGVGRRSSGTRRRRWRSARSAAGARSAARDARRRRSCRRRFAAWSTSTPGWGSLSTSTCSPILLRPSVRTISPCGSPRQPRRSPRRRAHRCRRSRATRQARLQALRARLGNSAFDAADEAGRERSMQEASAEALAWARGGSPSAA
jgi:hypothetical protein